MSASWIGNTEKENEKVNEMGIITVLELKAHVFTTSQKWKSPGIDKVPNFWLNALSLTHTAFATLLNEIMQNPEKTPEWMCEGTTYLLKTMTQKTLKTINRSLVFQQPTNF